MHKTLGVGKNSYLTVNLGNYTMKTFQIGAKFLSSYELVKL
jgi:hypothetical protein